LSILTKIFVVLVTVASVALVGLVVANVANQQNYRELAKTEEVRRAAAEQASVQLQGQLRTIETRHAEDMARITAAKQQSDNLITTLETNLETEKANVAREIARNASFQANELRMTATLEQYTKLLQAAQADLKALREQSVTLQTQHIQVVDRNTELQGQVEALTRTINRLREDGVTLQESLAKVEALWSQVSEEEKKRITGATAGPTAFVTPDRLIAGKVVSVQTQAGKTWALINVGASSQVAPNTLFRVSRGKDFIANLVVAKIDDRSSAGMVVLLGDKGDVQVGDDVMAGVK
jgi:hypothetical protein